MLDKHVELQYVGVQPVCPTTRCNEHTRGFAVLSPWSGWHLGTIVPASGGTAQAGSMVPRVLVVKKAWTQREGPEPG
jgi:hypothetical protein